VRSLILVTQHFGDSLQELLISIVYEIWIGEAAKLAKAGGNTLAAHKILCWFVLVGWAIYPLGYMLGTDGWYTGFLGKGMMQFTTSLISTKLGLD
jgi:bacteriorhodopsin